MGRQGNLKIVLIVVLVLIASMGAWIFILAPGRVPDHAYFDLPGPWVIAHRGGRGLWPENTLYAFRRAVEIGADVLEMDVRRTSDGALVVFHDEDVERTTNGHGPVHQLTLEELQALDAGYQWTDDGGKTYPFRERGIRVPTLEEVFRAFPGVRLNIEIKPRTPAVADEICQFIRSFGREDTVLVASFHQDSVDKFRSGCPEVATSATFKEVLFFLGLNRFFLGALYRPTAEAFLVPPRSGDVEVLTRRFIRTAQRLNVRVQAWTVDDVDESAKLLELGVNGIMTDYPDRLLKRLGR